jgi:hypothetical protein
MCGMSGDGRDPGWHSVCVQGSLELGMILEGDWGWMWRLGIMYLVFCSWTHRGLGTTVTASPESP